VWYSRQAERMDMKFCAALTLF